MCTCQRTLFKSAFTFNYLYCSQVWFPTVQDVLQADWQDVWHSPHPPFLIVFCNFLVFNVFTCFIIFSPFCSHFYITSVLSHSASDIISLRSLYHILCHMKSIFYTSQLFTVLGNGITSRMFDIPVKYITHLSNPSPNPA